jgi:stress-induced morphogen
MMSASHIQALVKAELPDAQISLEDISENGTHYAMRVSSSHFNGMSEINRRRIVSFALRDHLGRDLCGISLTTA